MLIKWPINHIKPRSPTLWYIGRITRPLAATHTLYTDLSCRQRIAWHANSTELRLTIIKKQAFRLIICHTNCTDQLVPLSTIQTLWNIVRITLSAVVGAFLNHIIHNNIATLCCKTRSTIQTLQTAGHTFLAIVLIIYKVPLLASETFGCIFIVAVITTWPACDIIG